MLNISACIITNNNHSVLNAIKSVYDSVSEIILVNTCEGFTIDLTEYDKVKLYSFDWNDSFSDARNFSISKATGDWILIIDSDETMKQGIKYLSDQYDLYFANVYNGYTPYLNLRIFKNNIGIKYKYKLHESIEHYVTKGNTSYSELIFEHTGCMITGFELESKIKRNEKIMLTDLDNPVRNFHLGLYRMYYKDYKQAIEYFLNVLNDEVNPEHKAHACNNAFECFLKLGSVQIDLIRQSLQYFPGQIYGRIKLIESMIGHFKHDRDETLRKLIVNEFEKIKVIESKLSNDIKLDIHLINEKQKEIQQWQLQ